MEHKKLIPNSTQIPNVLIDRLFPFLTDSELRAILYIARRTYGFQKEKDSIGLGQFVDGIVKANGEVLDNGAGLTRTTAMRTLKVLGEVGLIDIKRTKPGQRGRKENVYSINLDCDIDALIHKLETVRVDIKGKRPRKATLFDFIPKPTRVAPDTSTTPDTRVGSIADPSTMVAPDTHKTKGNKVTKQSIYAPKAHSRIIKFFHDTSIATRGVKPAFGVEDGKRLKDVLALELIPEHELEKIILYYLGHYSFKTFSPSVKTMLSAGILNGIQNKIRNDEKFWKDLDQITDRVYPRVRPVREKLEPGDEEDYRQPVKGPTQLGDLIKQMTSRLGLIATVGD